MQTLKYFFFLIPYILTFSVYSQVNFEIAPISENGNSSWEFDYNKSKYKILFLENEKVYSISGSDSSYTEYFMMATAFGTNGLTVSDSLRIEIDYETKNINGGLILWSRIDYLNNSFDLKSGKSYTVKSNEKGTLIHSHLITDELKKINFGIGFIKAGEIKIKGCRIFINNVEIKGENFTEKTWAEFMKDAKPFIFEFEDENKVPGILHSIEDLNNAALIGFGEQTHGVMRNYKIREVLIDYLLESKKDLNVFFEYDYASAATLNNYANSLFEPNIAMKEVWSNGSWPFYTKSFESILNKISKINSSLDRQLISICGLDLPKDDSIFRLKSVKENEENAEKAKVLEQKIDTSSKFNIIKKGTRNFSDLEVTKADIIFNQYDSSKNNIVFAHNNHIIKNQISLGNTLYNRMKEGYYSICYSFKTGNFNVKGINSISVKPISMIGKRSIENLNDSNKSFVFDIRDFKRSEKYLKWKDYLIPIMSIGATIQEHGKEKKVKLLQDFDMFICVNEEFPTIRYK